MPVKTTTLATEPVLVQQHELVVTLVDPANAEHKGTAKANTFSAILLTYGATLTHVRYPDRWNQLQDVVLGFDNWKSYRDQGEPGELNPYFGAIIGRTASRIGRASFALESTYDPVLTHGAQGGQNAQSVSESTGPPHTPRAAKRPIQTQNQAQARYQEYEPRHTLEISNGVDCLHGGLEGFDKQHWTTIDVQQEDPSVTLQLISPHGQGGYPGRLVTRVQYKLTSLGELSVEYWAELEAERGGREKGDNLTMQDALDLHSTIVSLTSHTYWNLDGVLNPTDGTGVKAAEAILEGLINDDALEGQEQQQHQQEKVVALPNHLSVKNHTLWLSSRSIIELGARHPIPTGQIIDVSSSTKAEAGLLDFTGRMPGSGLGLNHVGPGLDRIPDGYGYDHVYALSPPEALLSHSSSLVCDIGIQGYFPCTPLVATLCSPQTGIRLDLMTSEPALVLYTAGYLDDHLLPQTKSKDLDMPSPLMISPSATPLLSPAHSFEATFATNEKQQEQQQQQPQQQQTRKRRISIVAKMGKFSGISLEPIRYPDAIHHRDWANMVTLHHNQKYRQRSVYKFSVAD
ncbi:hypothetical protein KVV02_005667 [Mortierella alpina]|uniref:Uncharacterized protein n=1 Tax=Mortierella alpina TaxID=64518 RepID=A0A9P8A897_MORAP|nr:hypothetical protein KVV02_005667 [Mortierella alpina]